MVAAPAASAPLPSAVPPTVPAVPASAARPVDVEPRLGRVDLPSLGQRIDERKRQAREQAASAALAAVTPPTAPPARAAPEAPVLAPAFAVWTRALRTRSESSQVAEAMRGLLTGQAPPKMRVEVMPAGDDWRVVSWPYTTREQAERARDLLAARGMRVEVVEF